MNLCVLTPLPLPSPPLSSPPFPSPPSPSSHLTCSLLQAATTTRLSQLLMVTVISTAPRTSKQWEHRSTRTSLGTRRGREGGGEGRKRGRRGRERWKGRGKRQGEGGEGRGGEGEAVEAVGRGGGTADCRTPRPQTGGITSLALEDRYLIHGSSQ